MGKHGKPATTTAYLTAAMPEHPTAQADGRVRVHRAVLFDKIGPGIHDCHWCQRAIEWFALGTRAIVADHLDGNTWNNAPDNLVQSCPGCNSTRSLRAKKSCPAGHEYDDANTYVRQGTRRRMCRTCHRLRERARR